MRSSQYVNGLLGDPRRIEVSIKWSPIALYSEAALWIWGKVEEFLMNFPHFYFSRMKNFFNFIWQEKLRRLINASTFFSGLPVAWRRCSTKNTLSAAFTFNEAALESRRFLEAFVSFLSSRRCQTRRLKVGELLIGTALEIESPREHLNHQRKIIVPLFSHHWCRELSLIGAESFYNHLPHAT